MLKFAAISKHKHRLPYSHANDGNGFSNAACTCHLLHPAVCPRHDPVYYAECMARHASNVYGTGSI